MAEMKVEQENPAAAAWGGIGGSGKHAGEAIAELASVNTAQLIDQLPRAAWGGIGGSGRHIEDLTPEPTKR